MMETSPASPEDLERLEKKSVLMGLKQYFHVFPQMADNPQGGKKITLYKAI